MENTEEFLDNFIEEDREESIANVVRILIDDILNHIFHKDCLGPDIDFLDISNVVDNENSVATSENSSSSTSPSSSSGRGKVYRVVGDNDSDSEPEDVFYSSEDLIMKFIELDESNIAEKILDFDELKYHDSVSSSENNPFSNIENLQVEKHVLKFELSKQLFEEDRNNPVDEDDNTNSLEQSRDRKRKYNEELFAKLFDYDPEQVEEIKSGESQASKTLFNKNLLSLEKDLSKKKRYSCYEDIDFSQRSRKTLFRSSSQPNFESITEEDGPSSGDSPRSGPDTDNNNLRPILSLGTATVSTNASQTDITAIGSQTSSSEEKPQLSRTKSEEYRRNQSPNLSSLDNSNKKRYQNSTLTRSQSIDFDSFESHSTTVKVSPSSDQNITRAKSVTFLLENSDTLTRKR